MKKITLIDLESEERAVARAVKKSSVKDGFMERARKGRYGDLRLLGLSAGFVLLCVLSLVFRPEDANMRASNPSLEEAAVFTPPVFAATAEEQNLTETAFDQPIYEGMELDDALATRPAERTPEQRERLLREMAEDIPEGETLIW